MTPGFLRYLRLETLGGVVVAAVCLGLFLGGNHSPVVVAIGGTALIVSLGDRFLLRRRRR